MHSYSKTTAAVIIIIRWLSDQAYLELLIAQLLSWQFTTAVTLDWVQ